MSKIATLRAEKAALFAEMETISEGENFSLKRFNAMEKAAADIETQIKAIEKLHASNGATAEKTASTVGFKNLGENLLAIRSAALGGRVDSRLVKAPSGLGETDPQFGGFTIQPELAAEIITRIYDNDPITGAVMRKKVGPNSNGFRLPIVDETSRATGSRFGGIQTYWLDEGTAITPTKPKLKMLELTLRKIAGLWYVTDEMLADSVLLSGLAEEAFQLELQWMLANAIMQGNGVGQPLGILTGAGLLVQAGEKGQAAGSVLYQNIINMYSKIFAPSMKNAAWYVHQSTLPQLMTLSMVIGTAGYPLWQPSNLAAGQPNNTLLGLPVHVVEQVPSLGHQGCITLADLGAYMVIDRDQAQFASSIHVNFTSDEQVFRVVYRVAGAPLFSSTVASASDSTFKMSSYVALAAI